eukprot:3131804-Pleurochrysis_carterae.AAC.1
MAVRPQYPRRRNHEGQRFEAQQPGVSQSITRGPVEMPRLRQDLLANVTVQLNLANLVCGTHVAASSRET